MQDSIGRIVPLASKKKEPPMPSSSSGSVAPPPSASSSRRRSPKPASTPGAAPAYPGAPFDASGMCLSHPNVRLCRPCDGGDEDSDGNERRRYKIVRKTCPLCPSLRKVRGRRRRRERGRDEKRAKEEGKDRSIARAPGRSPAASSAPSGGRSPRGAPPEIPLGDAGRTRAASPSPAADRRAAFSLSSSAVDGGRTNSGLGDVLVHEISAVVDEESQALLQEFVDAPSLDAASDASTAEGSGSREGDGGADSDGEGDGSVEERTDAADRRAMYSLSTSAVDGGRTNSGLSDLLVHEISAVGDDASSFDAASEDGSSIESEGEWTAAADRRAMYSLSTSAVDGGRANSGLSDVLVHEISAVAEPPKEASSDTSATEESGSSGDSEGDGGGDDDGAPPPRRTTRSMYAREYERLVRTQSALALLRGAVGRIRPSLLSGRGGRGEVEVIPVEGEGGAAREVPVYPRGMQVYYRSGTGDGGTRPTRATILSVHRDDPHEPYYTIRVDGRERQTDNGHIVLSP